MNYSKVKKYQQYVKMVGDKVLLKASKGKSWSKARNKTNSFSQALNNRDPQSERWFKAQLPAYQRALLKQNRMIDLYIADFIWEDFNLIIEIDDASHERSGQSENDKLRDDYLANEGYTVVRIRQGDATAVPQIKWLLQQLSYWDNCVRPKYKLEQMPVNRASEAVKYLKTTSLRFTPRIIRVKKGLDKKGKRKLEAELQSLTRRAM